MRRIIAIITLSGICQFAFAQEATEVKKQLSGMEAYTMVEEFQEGNSKLTLPEVYEIIHYLFEQ